MKFFSPWAFLLALALPAIFAMWFLKLKGQEQQVSSNLIWKRILSSSDRGQPFDKLRKNILLYLQLLAAFAIMFAAVDPYVDFLGREQNSFVYVLDNSGSMGSVYGKTTAFQEAKKQIEDGIRDSRSGSVFTLIEGGKSPEIVMAETTDKDALLNSLRAIQPSHVASDILEAVDLARSAAKAEASNIVIFTDHRIPLEKGQETLHIISQGGENWGITRISSGGTDGKTAVITVQNYGNEKGTRDVVLFSDGKLSDTGTIELEAGKSGQLLLGSTPGAVALRAEISQADRLKADNSYFHTVGKGEKRVAVVGRDSVFLEKAAQLVDGMKLFKLEADKPIEAGYDLYILESLTDEEIAGLKLETDLPSGAPVFVIGNGADIVKDTKKTGTSAVRIAEGKLAGQLEGESFVMKEGYAPSEKWGQDVATTEDGAPMIRYGEYKGRRVSYIGFNLSDSDFPLNTAFPIVMDGLLRYAADLDVRGEGRWFCGDAVRLSVPNNVSAAELHYPDGATKKIATNGSETYIEDAREPGIYSLSGKGEKPFRLSIPVNFSPEESGGVSGESGVLKYDGKDMAAAKGKIAGKYLRNTLILILLLVILIEGEVYRRGL